MIGIILNTIVFYGLIAVIAIIVLIVILRTKRRREYRNFIRDYRRAGDIYFVPHSRPKDLYFYPNLSTNRNNKKSKTRKEKELYMDLLLSVPFSEKDEAKKNGAWWNPEIRKWYVREDSRQPYYLNWNKYFKKWLPEHNLLCRDLYIFEMQRKCWKCGKNTTVICLATKDAYTLFDGKTSDERYQNLQLLSYVDKIPGDLAKYLKEKYEYYPSFSNFVKRTYYINHCAHCGSVQGDNYLHELPEEAFYKHLCYKEADKSNYYKVKNKFLVPVLAKLPYYDVVAHSAELMLIHMQTEVENRASLNITQKLIDRLIEDSGYLGEIEINGI